MLVILVIMLRAAIVGMSEGPFTYHASYQVGMI